MGINRSPTGKRQLQLWMVSPPVCTSLKTVMLCRLCVVRRTAVGVNTAGLLQSSHVSPLSNDHILWFIISKLHGDQHFSCRCHDFTPTHLEVFRRFCRFSGFICGVFACPDISPLLYVDNMMQMRCDVSSPPGALL